MPAGWLLRLPKRGRRRAPTAPRRPGGTRLDVRRLERRRVLSASITSLIVPTVAAEGDTLTAEATATGVGSLFFDWSLREGFAQVDSASGTNLTTFTFTVPDNGTYDLRLRVFDAIQGSDSQTVSIDVANVDPTIDQLAITTPIQENDFATLTGSYSDPGLLDTHELDIDWNGDGVFDQTVAVSGGTFHVERQFLDDAPPKGVPEATFDVFVRLRDNDGGFDTDVVSLTVHNVPPVLTVVGDQTIDEGSLLDLSGIEGAPHLGTFTDVGTLDTHSATIDWGDGSLLQPATVIQQSGGGLVQGSHTYADDGVYTVTVTLMDDDTGTDVQTFAVTVENVDPTLTGTDNLEIDEGQAFTLSGLGVGISDPGFDNPNNPLSPPDGSVETFEVMAIDWGDGSPLAAASPVNRVSGSAGVPTTAELDHAPHTYADNGLYTVTITLRDDDGDWVDRSFSIRVDNVVPTLVVTDQTFIIDEGTLLEIPNLARLTDPGFDNPANPLSPPDGSVERFRFWIDWGDGTTPDTGDAAIDRMGEPGVLTEASFGGSHFYADNSPDNLFTITVRVADDDMAAYSTPERFATGVAGADFVEQSFQITVYNVNPTLLPITATDLDSRGITTLQLTFFDPGDDEFEVVVDWGDRLHEPNPEDRFVVERTAAGAGTHSFTINHRYTGPPDPLNPTADITIRVKIHDDDVQTVGVIEPGISNVESARIRNPGISDHPVAIDTTPQVPRLELSPPPAVNVFFGDESRSTPGLQTAEVRLAGSELAATAERYLELRVVYPDGSVSEGYRLSDDVLLDLRGLFATLPDGHYQIVLVRTENNSERLVVEVAVRGGRVVDATDDSDGTRDRPPTAENAEPLDDPAEANPSQQEDNPQHADSAAHNMESAPLAAELTPPRSASSLRYGAPLAGLALGACRTRRPWPQRLEAALQQADEQAWQRLRRAARLGRARNPT